MRLLLLTTTLPHRQRNGGEVVTFAFQQALLEMGHQVTVIGFDYPGVPLERPPNFVSAGARPIETQTSGIWKYLWFIGALVNAQPYSVRKYVASCYERAAARALTAEQPDAVIIDHAQMGWMKQHLPPDTAVAFLAHNVEGAVYDQLADTAGLFSQWIYRRESRRIGSLESELISRSRMFWALTRADLADLQAPGNRSSGVLLPVPAPYSTTVLTQPAAGGNAYDVVLLGTWTWRANRSGLVWFLEKVIPELPDSIRVGVAGLGANELCGQFPRVDFVGFVESASDFIATGNVVAIPTTQGGGVQIKTINAIGQGALVVATPLAVRGLDNLPSSVVVRKEPMRFAQAIIELLAATNRPELREEGLAWAIRRKSEFKAAVESGLERLGG